MRHVCVPDTVVGMSVQLVPRQPYEVSLHSFYREGIGSSGKGCMHMPCSRCSGAPQDLESRSAEAAASREAPHPWLEKPEPVWTQKVRPGLVEGPNGAVLMGFGDGGDLNKAKPVGSWPSFGRNSDCQKCSGG